MDNPDLRWPYWKFGLKRDDLFTKLHDQYNTTVQYISDPVAFQHDVFELSHEASTVEEFHQLMSARKEHRLNELNRSLESASFEIIANPALIGTEQWQHAVQLFRTRSLDSLVRYFASYLPNDHPWHHSDMSSASSLSGDSESIDDESTSHSENTMLFDEELDTNLDSYEDPFEADEQQKLTTVSVPTDTCLKPSDSTRADEYPFGFALTPARTLSFSESEPDMFHLKDSCPSLHEDDASQTSASSVSDLSETQHQKELLAEQDVKIFKHDAEYFSAEPQTNSKEDVLGDSEIPTPKPRADSGECFIIKPTPSPSSASTLIPGRRDTSSFRNHLLSHAATVSLGSAIKTTVAIVSRRQMEQQYSQTQSPSPARSRRRDYSPVGKGRSHGAAVTGGRVQKLSDSTRPRNRGRRAEAA